VQHNLYFNLSITVGVVKESGCGLFKATFSHFLEAMKKTKKITASKIDI
jgi:hypothetical protein